MGPMESGTWKAVHGRHGSENHPNDRETSLTPFKHVWPYGQYFWGSQLVQTILMEDSTRFWHPTHPPNHLYNMLWLLMYLMANLSDHLIRSHIAMPNCGLLYAQQVQFTVVLWASGMLLQLNICVYVFHSRSSAGISVGSTPAIQAYDVKCIESDSHSAIYTIFNLCLTLSMLW